MLTNCKYCNSTNLVRTQREFKDKSKHLEVRCVDCEKWLKWEFNVEDENFLMPYGRHKGMKLIEIIDKYPDYSQWLIETQDINKNIKNRFIRLLEARKGIGL